MTCLQWILHDWNDEQCVKILKKCKEAIKSKVIIIDMVVENEKGDDESIETQLFIPVMQYPLQACHAFKGTVNDLNH